VLTKSKLEDDDVVLEPYPAVSVDKDFMRSLPDLKDGEKLELGGAGANSVTTKDFQEAAALDAGYSIHNEEQNQAHTSQMAETAGAAGENAKPDWRHMSDDEKLKEYNDQMLVQSAKEGDTEPSPQKATPEATEDNSPEALITKTGRLSAGRRLQFMGEQMLTGIKAFWNKYKVWIISGFVAALVIIAGMLFFSAGTALSIIVQVLGEALTLLFGAYAVFRAMGMLWEYVKKAWAGDKEGAAKALASAFAIIVVEFFIDKILMGMGKVYKRVLKVFKSTKVGRAVRTGLAFVKRTQRRTRDLLKKGMTALRGKRVVIYLEKIAVKGANKLDDLRNKILTKFCFKEIWLEKHGKFMELWGEFNSSVLLMREDVEGNKTADVVDVDSKQLRKDLNSNQLIGKEVQIEGNKGFVIDDVGNKYSTEVQGYTASQKLDEYNALNELDEIERANKIRGGTKSERVALRKDVLEEIWARADTGRTEIINGKEYKIYRDGKTRLDIPNYGTHYPEKTPLGHPDPRAGQPVPENLIGKPRADIGHNYNETWEKRLKMHKEKGHTREQIIEAENNADLYIIEERSSNRSRKLD
ncbi:MAG: hypothetical protein JNN23_12940, partial [Chryseobacterium gambrini]|nr:hypothetical protein [Chryseobacterium gambrini]